MNVYCRIMVSSHVIFTLSSILISTNSFLILFRHKLNNVVADSLSTGSKCLDHLLGDGIPRGQITLIYGEPNTGKTTLAIQCAVNSARKGFKAIFIDSDPTFSITRLSQIANFNVSSISPLIFIFRPHSFYEQSILFENLCDYISKDTGLVVVDTINSLYRVELESTEKIFVLNRELNRQLAYLCEVARSHEIVVLIVSQVRQVIQGKHHHGMIEPVASRLLKFWSQNIINLGNTSRHFIRKAQVEKSTNPYRRNNFCYYKLDKNGITRLKE